MSLISGSARWDVSEGKYIIDDEALEGSLAKAIDEEMSLLYRLIKGSSLPEVGSEDRRILFLAISRGLLKYLQAKDKETISSITIKNQIGTADYDVIDMNLNITIPGL